MMHPRRPLRAALAAVAALVAASCADLATEVSSPGMRMLDGTYDLVSINQQPLPYTTSNAAVATVRITSGRLTMEPIGSFQQVLGFSGPTSQWQSATVGTYTLEGTRLSFRVSTGSTFDGTVYPDGRIEYVVPGNYGPLTFVYRRT